MATSPTATVTFVTVVDPSVTRGGGVATKEIIKAFSSYDRIDLSLICPRPVESLPDAIIDELATVRYLSERTSPGSITYHGREEVILFKQLALSLHKDDPDIVVARLAPSLAVPPVLAKAFGVPYVPLTRGWLGLDSDKQHRKWSSLVRWVYKLNFAFGDHTYVPVADIESEIRFVSTSIPITVFPNAVDPDLFEPMPLVEAREALDYDLDTDDFVVGFVGSLAERHRLNELIEGFNEAFPCDPQAKILIVGGGDEENRRLDRLKEVAASAGVADRIIFIGAVDHERVPVHIASCDVMYGVSDPEFPTAPIKLFEYLACQRPVITTNQDELSFVGEHDLGVVLSELTASEVGAALAELATRDRGSLFRDGERGREYVVEHHTWSRLPKLVLEKTDWS